MSLISTQIQVSVTLVLQIVHSLIYASRRLVSPKCSPRFVTNRQFRNFNPDSFSRDIQIISWDTILDINNLLQACEQWKQLFLTVADTHAPLRKKRIWNQFAPWLTPDIKSLMWERDGLRRIAIMTNDQTKWDEFKRLKNQVNHSNSNREKTIISLSLARMLETLDLFGKESIQHFLERKMILKS